MFHIFFCCERVNSIKFYRCCAGCVVLVKTTQLVNERREVCRCAHIRQTKYDPQNRISMLVDCVETKAGRVALLPTWALIGFEWFWWAISCEYRMIRRDDCSEVLDFFYSHTIIYASLIAIITIININFSITGIISISISITWNILWIYLQF